MKHQDWDARYASAELVWSSEPNRLLADEVAELSPGRALDLGCGEGRNAIWLAEHGWQVTGIDFSEAGLTKARRIAASRGVEVVWVRADVLRYRPGEDSFDLVIVLYLHLPAVQRREVLKRAAAALAPGGTLLLVGHDRSNLSQGYGGPQNPGVLFTPTEIERELPGLIIERAERVLRPLTVEGREVSAIDAVVRAQRPLHAAKLA